MADLARPQLTALRNGLLRWHKSLLDSERAAYERDVARITSTGQYLQLVLDDPWFAWLREISQFIVIVDETLAQKEEPATPADAARLIGKARDLLLPSGIRLGIRAPLRPGDAARSGGRPGHGEMMQVFAELAKSNYSILAYYMTIPVGQTSVCAGLQPRRAARRTGPTGRTEVPRRLRLPHLS